MTEWSEASRGFSGTIADFPLTSVFQILELGKKSGFLYVRQFPKISFLVFRDGGIIQAVSSMRRVGLGELLIAEGLIKEEDLSEALGIQRRAPKKKVLGEIFEGMGLVTHDQIVEVLTSQMKAIVQWILRWKEGEFTFYAGEEARPELHEEEEEMVLPTGIVVQEVLQSMMDDKDRRQHPRVPVSIKVVQTTREGEQIYYTRDVSAGGLFIMSAYPPEMGEVLELELWVPTLLEPSFATCKVVRVIQGAHEGQRGFAVEFQKIDDEARKILERLGGALSKLL